ncbi:MAG: type secretion system protein [Pedosphaera sp.]|nr:type secretion system protein [Pedosphaera sp.]
MLARYLQLIMRLNGGASLGAVAWPDSCYSYAETCDKGKLMNIRVRSGKAGFTLVEIMIVVAIIGLLAAIAIPNYMKSRETSQLNAIYNNIRVLEDAKEQWALETHQLSGQPVASLSVVTNYLKGAGIQTVINESYVPNPIGTPAGASLPPGVSIGTYAAGAFIPCPGN